MAERGVEGRAVKAQWRELERVAMGWQWAGVVGMAVGRVKGGEGGGGEGCVARGVG